MQQVGALVSAAARELSWGLLEVRREAVKWQQRAERIPDEPIREDALRSLNRKRGNVVGAALFATLPTHRSVDLVQTLATFQTVFDFLDEVNERHPEVANGHGLHLALIDALDPGQPLRDYYAQHLWKDDGGYLAALVEDCRRRCEGLPSFERVQPFLARETGKAQQVLAFNHLPDSTSRDSALQGWAERECRGEQEWSWFELAAAASGQLAIFALLALAAEPNLSDQQVAETYEVYWPLLPLAATMLDSFVDQAEDDGNGEHQYVAHYLEPELAVLRMAELIERSARDVLSLPGGHRHAVVVSCMVTFYLSKDSARTPAMEPHTEQLVHAGGSLPRLLVPILRIWRTAYAQRSA